MSKKHRHGYIFESEIRLELYLLSQEKGLFFHRLVDTHAFKRLIDYARKHGDRPLANFTMPRQPADYMAVYRGQITFIECKSSKVKTSFSFKRAFYKSQSGAYQLEQAHKILKAGGQYWFTICRRVPYEMKIYAIRPQVLQRLLNRVLRAKKASVKWEIVEKNATHIIERGTTSRPWIGVLPLVDGSLRSSV